ncbi:MAG: SMC family ATPase [Ruminococcus flavefaciens]|nr:SMC family ATPase [Ruminococcus flavefaciens]
MKPLQLIMKSFGSYGEMTVIDFTKCEQNLFLITGNTGSGKSTLFDAIVFALYGESSSGTNRKSGRELQSQYTDYTGETFVELTFMEKTGTEVRKYIVRREPRQLRVNRKSGNTRELSEKITLIMPDGTVLSQKEANRKIEEIVVLTKSQFMQVSMIAQGEFIQLLKASSNEKKKILRKLFNTEIFEQIVNELKQRRKSAGDRINVIETVCRTETEHIIIPKDYCYYDVMNKLKKNIYDNVLSAYSMENLTEYLEKLCGDMNARKISAEKEYRKVLNDSNEKRDSLKNAVSLLKTFEEMENAEREISECEKSESLINDKKNLSGRINSAYEIQAVHSRYRDILSAVSETETALERQKSIIPELRKEHDKLSDEKNKALEIKNSALAEFAQTAERVNNNLEILRKLARIDSDINKKRISAEKSERSTEIIMEKILQVEKNIAECRDIADKISETEKNLFEWQSKNAETERIYEDYQLAVKTFSEIETRKKYAEDIQQEYISVRNRYSSVLGEYTAKRTAFLDAQAGFIAKEKLRDGEPCPVCGSIEHPKPCILSEMHSGLTREVIDRLSEEVSALDRSCNEKSAQANSALEILREREEFFDNTMRKLYDRMLNLIPDISLNYNIRQTGKIISEWKLAVSAEGVNLRKIAEKCRQAQKMLEEYEKEKERLIPELEKEKNTLSEIQSELSGSMRIKKELSGSLCYPDEISARHALAQAGTLKDEKTAIYNTISDRLNAVQKRLEEANTLIKRYSEELPEKKKILAQRKSEYADIMLHYSLTECEWQEISQKYRKDYIDILRLEIERHNHRKLSAQTVYNLSKKTIGENVRPDISVLEKAYNLAEEKLATVQKKLEDCREIYRADNGVYKLLSGYMKEYNTLNAEYERLNRLCNRLSGTASGEHIGIETFVQRYYLQKILDGANVHFQRMSSGQFELRLMDEEQASSSGRTERGLDLTVYSVVTGKEREIHTLSGGEMFMGALSLALGISEQIQESTASVNPDIMFIDEGFGALDEESRNQAVRVLKEMAEENRLIGIISHVTEMKQEIDTQLIVSKNNKGSHVRWSIN